VEINFVRKPPKSHFIKILSASVQRGRWTGGASLIAAPQRCAKYLKKKPEHRLSNKLERKPDAYMG
jgi:hypothetical protein